MNLTPEQLAKLIADQLPKQNAWIPPGWGTIILLAIGAIVGIWAMVMLGSWIGTFYQVWQETKLADLSIVVAQRKGLADLAEARNEQQVQVAEAQGRLDAALLQKQAEIIDAEAVAKSVEIIGTSLHANEGYLRWQWIHMMKENENNTVIYVPTEAGLPILEAGKRKEAK